MDLLPPPSVASTTPLFFCACSDLRVLYFRAVLESYEQAVFSPSPSLSSGYVSVPPYSVPLAFFDVVSQLCDESETVLTDNAT